MNILLELLIVILVVCVLVAVVRFVGRKFEIDADAIKIILMVIGVVFLIYLLVLAWPFVTNPGHWHR